MTATATVKLPLKFDRESMSILSVSGLEVCNFRDSDFALLVAVDHAQLIVRALEALRTIADAADDVTGGARFVAIAKAALSAIEAAP